MREVFYSWKKYILFEDDLMPTHNNDTNNQTNKTTDAGRDAANEAARIEAMCKTLEVSPIVSAAFAGHVPDRLRSLGRHALRGVSETQELYTLRA